MADATILAEQTLSGFEQDNTGWYGLEIYPATFTMTPGEEYRVVWEGTTHNCTAHMVEDIWPGLVYIGNGSDFGYPGNEEPFIIGWDEAENVNILYSLTDNKATHAVGIYQVESESGIIIHDRIGTPITYSGVGRIRVETSDGEKQEYINCDVTAANISLDFSKTDMMTITPANGALFDEVNIPKPVNLVSDYIAEGIDIAGVTGSLVAGGSGMSDADKPIRFYDPYGNVIYGYTKKEIQELEELPEGPALTGLVFDQWTHTLDELKATPYFADVGPSYKYGSYYAHVLIIETLVANTSVQLKLDLTSTSGNIYWGDGKSDALKATTTHTYTNAGEHIIAVVDTSDMGVVRFGSSDNSAIYNVVGANTTNRQIGADSNFHGTTVHYLKSILISPKNFFNVYSDIKGVVFNSGLKFASFCGTGYAGYDIKSFAQCSALRVIAGKRECTNSGYSCFMNVSLRRWRVNDTRTAADTAFIGCSSLEEVIYGAQAINIPKMNVQWAMLMTSETPPTISATSPVWGTKPIYVPDTAVDAYKTAAGWSTVANYILPASQYHKN